MLNILPDEILSYIFTFIVNDILQLIQLTQVSKRYYRLLENPKLWYLAFQLKYPNWGHKVTYSSGSHCLIDWKDFVIHLMKQQKSSTELSFEFVQEQYQGRKRKRQEEEKGITVTTEATEFWIQDPLVVDIDRISNTGIVATGKHRKSTSNNVFNARSEHKILFWEYPSWKLIRVFELELQPPTLTCQIISVQTVRMHSNIKARFFSLAVGITLMNDLDNEDRADIWKSLFIYRLFDNGDTQCMAHIKIDELFLGREVFLFSDASWCQSNDGNDYIANSSSPSKLKDWMQIVLPKHSNFDARYTVFVLAMGPIYQRITGCVQIAKFDIRGQSNILDPSRTPTIWDMRTHQLISIVEYLAGSFNYTPNTKSATARLSLDNPTEMLTSIQLGDHVSCMIHFKYPPSLNHLICTGSSMDDELSVYDWRFGLKVGSLPWKSAESHNHHHIPPRIEEEDFLNIIRQQNLIIPLDEEEDTDEDPSETTAVDVKPWGLESTLAIPPYWSSSNTKNTFDFAQNGFRLIAVGDNRAENTKDKLEIKVWDISYLLSVDWNPLQNTAINIPAILNDHINNYFDQRFSWWPRRTKELTKVALCMLQSHHYKRKRHAILPYSPPVGSQSIILSHTFDRDDGASVKYTAYNVLHTSLFLLTEEGKVTVMDIETGEITGTVENIANDSKVIGIDVSVIGGKEVVVTSKEGLLRGIAL